MIANDFGSLQANRSRRNEQEVANYFRAIDEGMKLAQLDESALRSDRDYFTSVDDRRLTRAQNRADTRYNRDYNERKFAFDRENAGNNLSWRADENRIDRERMALTQKLADEKARIDRFNYENSLASEGIGGSSPNLTDEENAMLWETRSAARKDLGQQQNYFRSIADTLNENPAMYDNMVAAEKQTNRDWLKKGLFWDTPTPDADKIAEWTAEGSAIRKRQADAKAAMADKYFQRDSIINNDGVYSVAPLPWESAAPVRSVAPVFNPAAAVAAPVEVRAAAPKLTRDAAVLFLRQAGGDKAAARRLAIEAGYAL